MTELSEADCRIAKAPSDHGVTQYDIARHLKPTLDPKMKDELLDYGDPTEAEGRDDRMAMERTEDVDMDAEMETWANNYEGDMDQFEEQKEQKIQQLKQAKSEVKFYPLPREEGVSAGANRGVSSHIELEDTDLLGPEEEIPLPDMPSPIGGGQDVRYSVLHLSGPPVTQCSTSRLFAYVTHYGAQPLGLEWVNDSSCNIVFSDSSAARLAIEYLCPAVSTSHAPLIPLPNDQQLDEAVWKKKQLDDPNNKETLELEWDKVLLQSLLFPRKALRIPARLYNAPERDAAMKLQEEQKNQQTSALPEDVPEIYREMEAEDRKRQMQKPEQVNLQKLRGTLFLRWALESLDVKPSRAAKHSKWYQEHGTDAGKEVVTKLLDVGQANDRLELLPPSIDGNRRQRQSNQVTNDTRGRGGRQAAMDEMDADIEAYTIRGGEYSNEGRPSGQNQNQRRGRGERRGRMTMEALDEQLELDRRDRSASPVRFQSDYSQKPNRGSSGGHHNSVKVKGRGRMKAPSAWNDDDDVDDHHSSRSGMMADDYTQRRRNGGQREKWADSSNTSLEQRMSGSLEQRIGGNHLLDRLS